MRHLPLVLLLISMGVGAPAASGQGIFLTGVGAINRSMGGASTAAPIDAMGALHWNPASIAGMAENEMAMSAEILVLDQELASVIPGFAGGSDSAESGAAPIPAVGWVHRVDDSPLSIGLGMYSFAGFLQNMPLSTPATTNNPVLFTPALGGVGPLFSEAQFFQIAPTAAYAVSERLAIGVAPTVTIGRLALDPNGFTAPLNNGQFPPGRATRYHWGGGAQLGVYYLAADDLNLGMSIKSPQWFEEFRFTSITGDPANPTANIDRAQLDLPMIISLGAAYTGVDDCLLAVDVRYFDYKNTAGFGRPGFTGGLATSLHWDNVFSVSTGLQRRIADRLVLRCGYTFNTSPIGSADAFTNIASSLHHQHVAGVGGSYELAPGVDLALSYNQLFRSSSRGPIPGPVPPGSTVSVATAVYGIALGVTVRYGNRGR